MDLQIHNKLYSYYSSWGKSSVAATKTGTNIRNANLKNNFYKWRGKNVYTSPFKSKFDLFSNYCYFSFLYNFLSYKRPWNVMASTWLSRSDSAVQTEQVQINNSSWTMIIWILYLTQIPVKVELVYQAGGN